MAECHRVTAASAGDAFELAVILRNFRQRALPGHADQKDIPLVIDQPEENLDNESVYKVLMFCIKEAKKRRQIIIVTHNPNLAVVCDAEQIIYSEIDKQNGNRITYTCGAIENPTINKKLIDVLEGTRPAFNNRDHKYYVES